MIRTRPVKRHRPPRYPTRLELARAPAPPSRTKSVMGAVAIAIATSSGAIAADPTTKSTPPCVIAPVFEHGEGRGATGCVVVSPPVFLSEEEALQIIREQLERAGLKETPHANVTLPGVGLPNVGLVNQQVGDHFEEDLVEQRPWYGETRVAPLEVDLDYTQHDVKIELVSATDHRAWVTPSRSTINPYDLKTLAEWLGSRVARAKAPGVFAALYAPIGDAGWTDDEKQQMRRLARRWPDPGAQKKMYALRAEAKARALASSKEDLRAQVRDLAAWLEAQGLL